ncbi:MAG TPA: DinB family protein [Tepidiformaceae bacterium]
MPEIPAHLRDAFARFKTGPTLVRSAVSGVDPALLNRRPPGDEWSIRDVIIHLSDTELVRAVRLRMMLAEEQPHLPDVDEGLWKRKLHYLWRDPESAISLFQQTRYANAELLAQCYADAWERTAIHASLGVMTVADQMIRGADHVDDHVGQIRRNREP